MDDGVRVADRAPETFAALREALIERQRKLPKRLAQVAAFAMAHPDEIAFGTAASIAQRAEVQPSTLVRFAQALGYGGFSDLQSVFRERLRDRVPSYEERLRALRDHSETALKVGILFEGFATAAEQSVRVLRDRLRPEALDAAVSLLAPADTIYLIGQRRSFPVTAYLNYAFGKLGVKNVLVGSGLGNDPETLVLRDAGRRRARGELHALRLRHPRLCAADRRQGNAAGRDHRQSRSARYCRSARPGSR